MLLQWLAIVLSFHLVDIEWLGQCAGDAVAGTCRPLESFQYGHLLCYGRTTACCYGARIPRKQVRIQLIRSHGTKYSSL